MHAVLSLALSDDSASFRKNFMEPLRRALANAGHQLDGFDAPSNMNDTVLLKLGNDLEPLLSYASDSAAKEIWLETDHVMKRPLHVERDAEGTIDSLTSSKQSGGTMKLFGSYPRDDSREFDLSELRFGEAANVAFASSTQEQHQGEVHKPMHLRGLGSGKSSVASAQRRHADVSYPLSTIHRPLRLLDVSRGTVLLHQTPATDDNATETTSMKYDDEESGISTGRMILYTIAFIAFCVILCVAVRGFA